MTSHNRELILRHDSDPVPSDAAIPKMGKAVLEIEGDMLAAESKESLPGMSYKFNFSLHSEENAPEIAASLSDCDIIAIEATGDTQQRRKQREAVFTQLLSDKIPRSTLEQALALLAKGEGSEGFIAKLLENFAGSNKRVVLIDMAADEPDAYVLEEMDRADKAFYEGIATNLPSNRLKSQLIESVKATANASMKREELAARQLAAIQQDKDAPAAKIGVVMGAIHTPVYHTLGRTSSVERTFTDTSDESPSFSRANYGHTEQAVRQLRFNPDKELDASLVNRMLVESMYYAFGFYRSENVTETHNNDHRARQIQKEISDKMSDEDVEAFLTELDTIKANGSRGVFGKRKPVSTEQVHQFLLEQQRHYDKAA